MGTSYSTARRTASRQHSPAVSAPCTAGAVLERQRLPHWRYFHVRPQPELPEKRCHWIIPGGQADRRAGRARRWARIGRGEHSSAQRSGRPGPEAAGIGSPGSARPAPAPASPTRPTPLLEAEALRGLLSPTGLWPSMAWKRQTSTSGLHTTTASSAGTPGSGAEAAAAAAAATAAAAAATAAAVPGPAEGSGGFSAAAVAAPPSASPMAAPCRAAARRPLPFPRAASAAAPGGRRSGLDALPAVCWRGGQLWGVLPRAAAKREIWRGTARLSTQNCSSLSRRCHFLFLGTTSHALRSAEPTCCVCHLRHESVSFGKKEHGNFSVVQIGVFWGGWLLPHVIPAHMHAPGLLSLTGSGFPVALFRT